MNAHAKITMQLEHKTESQGIPLSALAIPLLLGIYLLITSTRYLFSNIAMFDAKRMIEITVFGVILVLAILDPKLRMELAAQFRQIPRWIGLGLLGFIGLGVISSVYNASSPFALAYSLADVYMLAIMIVLALVVAACRTIAGTKFDQLAMFCLALLGLAVGLQELIGVAVAWGSGYQFSYDIALAHFAHPRFYNQLQSWTIPLLAALPVVFSRYRPAALLCVLILGLHWYILLMTGARGGTLSLLAAFTISGVLFPGIRRTIIKWQSAGIVLGALIYSLMLLGPDTGFEPLTTQTQLQNSPKTHNALMDSSRESDLSGEASGKDSNPYFELSLGRPMLNTSGRLRLWRMAAEYGRENPVLGIGPMNYACKGPSGWAGHPHNFVMQLLSEWGIPATLLALSLLFFILARLLRRLKTEVGENLTGLWQLQVALSTSILAAVMYSGFSAVLIMPASQVTAILICGWLLGTFSPSAATAIDFSAEHGGVQYRRVSMLILITSLTATMVLWPFGSYEVNRMGLYQEQLPHADWTMPRFWQLGKTCWLHAHPE